MFGDPVTNPKGYSSASLGDLVEIISGGTPSRAEKRFWNGMFPWVSPKDMKSITINNSIDKISENVFSETPLRRIPQKSILVVIRGMILAHTIPIAITEKEVAINQDIKALIPKESIVPQFLLWSLIILHNFLLSKVSTAAHGTKRLDMESLKNTDILLPTIVQQNQFVEIANKFSSVKNGQTLSLEQKKAMFNSLTQRAFRGEL
jgi:type I restriction enzyme S subunit